MSVAIVTGASRGLGAALARGLADAGWRLVIDARGAADLEQVAASLAELTDVIAIPGDINDAAHRAELVAATRRLAAGWAPEDRPEASEGSAPRVPQGSPPRVPEEPPAGGHGLNLLVNNAGTLGPSPLPRLADLPLQGLRDIFEANVIAQLGLVQDALPLLRAGQGSVLNITSDAAVEAYEGWGGYGASKAALEQVSRVLAAEEPRLRVWWVDPGDMRTQMHQDAFPGEDISDRPKPSAVVPSLMRLIWEQPPSGRYRAADFRVPRPLVEAGDGAEVRP